MPLWLFGGILIGKVVRIESTLPSHVISLQSFSLVEIPYDKATTIPEAAPLQRLTCSASRLAGAARRSREPSRARSRISDIAISLQGAARERQ